MCQIPIAPPACGGPTEEQTHLTLSGGAWLGPKGKGLPGTCRQAPPPAWVTLFWARIRLIFLFL